ncbi:MAG: glycoside hydrolase, partial [Frankia sp.]|nr:glycoside hydrolase [Frankia sp.]
MTLRPVVRIQTPTGLALCPAESEPEATWTSAGTWVAYNDLRECGFNPLISRVTGVQLIPARGGAPRFVELPTAPLGEAYSGDPELMPDPRGDGSVVLTTLYSNGSGLTLGMFRITPALQVTRLPSPSRTSGASDDKEFAAVDTSPRSKYRGRMYVAWDDFAASNVAVEVRAYAGHWLDLVKVATGTGAPDLAVAPNGTVAVAYEAGDTGVAVRISRDGGRSFGDPSIALRGGSPGRRDPGCPLRP